VGIGRDQIKEGAHILDVCVDYTGADGVSDMNEMMSRSRRSRRADHGRHH